MVRIDHSAVSREHAVLYWNEGLWELKDLGSRNGTIVDGKRLKKGESVRLNPGAEIKFGDEGVAFRLVDPSAPKAFAVAPDGTEMTAEGEILFLPNEDDPEVTIFKSQESGWVCETESGSVPVDEWQTLALSDGIWHVAVPAALEVTEDAIGPALAVMKMTFRVSRDEEYVDILLSGRGRQVELKSRAFFYMLLTLARLRMKDADEGELPMSEQGWVHHDDLAGMLATDRATINVHVCRARRQLAKAGVLGAADVVERRTGTGQLRIGVPLLDVKSA